MYWKNEYSLGILEIDNQHKSLIRCFASIEESIKAGHTWSSTHFNIVSLKEVARFHFSCEEALMRLFGYPDIGEHSSQHEHFFTFLAEIENNSLHKSTEMKLVEFLRTWLTTHITGDDRVFARHILSGASIVATGLLD